MRALGLALLVLAAVGCNARFVIREVRERGLGTAADAAPPRSGLACLTPGATRLEGPDASES